MENIINARSKCRTDPSPSVCSVIFKDKKIVAGNVKDPEPDQEWAKYPGIQTRTDP
jgi:hypothetical protein